MNKEQIREEVQRLEKNRDHHELEMLNSEKGTDLESLHFDQIEKIDCEIFLMKEKYKELVKSEMAEIVKYKINYCRFLESALTKISPKDGHYELTVDEYNKAHDQVTSLANLHGIDILKLVEEMDQKEA